MTVTDLLPDFEVRVRDVIRENRTREALWSGLTVLLFFVGIGGVISAILSGAYLWSVPSGVVSIFLKQPLAQLLAIRRQNIALALAPALIRELPAPEAVMNIQRMLDTLFPESPTA